MRPDGQFVTVKYCSRLKVNEKLSEDYHPESHLSFYFHTGSLGYVTFWTLKDAATRPEAMRTKPSCENVIWCEATGFQSNRILLLGFM